MKIPVLTQAKEGAGEIEVSEEIFDGPVRRHLLYETVRMQTANRRSGTASTKTRGTVRGGGRKPWRQKGTGRARAGSIRSPLWPGGAITHGPLPRSYAYRMPSSARRAALRSALAMRAREGKLVVVDELTIEPAKTKTVVDVLQNLGVTSALVVTEGANEALERATRNLPYAKALRAEGLNVYDILRYEHLVLTRGAVDALQERATG